MVLPACRSDVLRFFHISHMFINHNKHVGNRHIKSATAETVSLARIFPAAGQKYHYWTVWSCLPHSMVPMLCWLSSMSSDSFPNHLPWFPCLGSDGDVASNIARSRGQRCSWSPAIRIGYGGQHCLLWQEIYVPCKWRWTRTSLSATGST